MVYQDQLCHLSLKELQTKALALVSQHGKNTHILSDVLNKLIMHFSMALVRWGLEHVSHPFSCSTQKAFYILSAGTAEWVGCDRKEVMKSKSVPACQPHPVPGLHVCTCACVSVCPCSRTHVPNRVHAMDLGTSPSCSRWSKRRARQELGAPVLSLLQRWKYHGKCKEKGQSNSASGWKEHNHLG